MVAWMRRALCALLFLVAGVGTGLAQDGRALEARAQESQAQHALAAAPEERAVPNPVRVPSAPMQSAAVTARVPAEPTAPFFDRKTLYLGCLFTASAGVLMLAHPAPGEWAIPGGWHIGVPATALRTILGCFYGILGGMAVSTVAKVWPW